MNKIYINTKELGVLEIISDQSAITELNFVKQMGCNSPSDILLLAKKQLMQYFDGNLTTFDLNLNCKGTEFQKKIWDTLKLIPYAQTISYAEESIMAGCSKSVRAVANANGKNPIPIIIPCHRVIRSDGTNGGYTGGVEKKEYLLELEKLGRCKDIL